MEGKLGANTALPTRQIFVFAAGSGVGTEGQIIGIIIN